MLQSQDVTNLDVLTCTTLVGAFEQVCFDHSVIELLV